MNDSEFVAAFEACAIAKTDFHHADHVRLAWIYLRGHPLIEAIQRFTTSLQRFSAHHGIPALYHETITWAYLLLIHERMQRMGAQPDWSFVLHGEWRSFHEPALDPRALLRAGNSALGYRAPNIRPARCGDTVEMTHAAKEWLYVHALQTGGTG